MKNKTTLYLISLLIISLSSNLYAEDSNDKRKIIYKARKTPKKVINNYNDTSTIYRYVIVDKDVKLQTPIGDAKLHKYLLSKLKLDRIDTPKGNVLDFHYIIDKDGNVQNLKFRTQITPNIEQQVADLINGLTYTPAVKDSNNVAVQINESLHFPFFKRPKNAEFIEGSFWLPEYIGGESEMFKFISENLKYPKTKDSGRSLIRFVISKKGKIEDIYILESSGSRILDKAAVKVVERMPDWKPGLKNGKPVSIYFTIPIIFKRP